MRPVDVVVAQEFKQGAQNRITSLDDVTQYEMILDVGPRTISAFGKKLRTMKTVVWNGPTWR